MGLRTKEMAEATAVFSVEAAGQVYKQTNECVYLGGMPTTKPTYPSGRPVHTQRLGILRKYTLELYGRPSATLELEIRMLRAEELETILYAFVTLRARARATTTRCADPIIAF